MCVFACVCVSVPPPVQAGFFPMTSPLKYGAHSWTEIPLPSVFITSLLHSHPCVSQHTDIHLRTHIHKLRHMRSSWEQAVLPGNQGAPIIAVYYSSHFPDSHIKQPSNPYDSPGLGRHAHTDPLGLSVEECGDAGSLGNQPWTLPMVRKGCSMSQIWLETHPDKSYCDL